MSILGTLEKTDREKLILSPIAVIDLIGKADGKLDNGEVKKSVEVIRKSNNYVDPFIGEIFSMTIEKMDTLLDQFMQQRINSGTLLNECNNILSNKLPQHTVSYQQALYKLGYEIADATGKILVGNINDQEEKALAKLKTYLPQE